jgi:hypothetical protein
MRKTRKVWFKSHKSVIQKTYLGEQVFQGFLLNLGRGLKNQILLHEYHLHSCVPSPSDSSAVRRQEQEEHEQPEAEEEEAESMQISKGSSEPVRTLRICAGSS